MAGPRSRVPRGRGDAGPDMKVLLTGREFVHGRTGSPMRWHAAGAHVVAPLARGRRKLRRGDAGRAGAAARGASRRSSTRRRSARSAFSTSPRQAASTFSAITRPGSAITAAPISTSPARVAENTANLRAVLERLAKGGLKGVVLTGSVFEEDEGAGEKPLVAFSPYGLSKGLTAAVVRHRCREAGLPFAKFVIPNPFGPLEEPRFCAYLVRTWKKGETARVNTPAYVRDNIPVWLLAKAYAKIRRRDRRGSGRAKLRPERLRREAKAPSPNASPPPCGKARVGVRAGTRRPERFLGTGDAGEHRFRRAEVRRRVGRAETWERRRRGIAVGPSLRRNSAAIRAFFDCAR